MAGDAESGVTIQALDAGRSPRRRRSRSAPYDAEDVFARAAEVAVRLLDSVLADPAPAFRPQQGEPTYAEKMVRTTACSISGDPPRSSSVSCAH